MPVLDLGDLGFDEGASVLVQRAVAGLRPGDPLTVTGVHPQLTVHLRAWARAEGHELVEVDGRPVIRRGGAVDDRWRHASRAGTASTAGIVERADPAWGLAARGALVEPGGPPSIADLVDRDTAWLDLAPRLYARALASQWDPATEIDWSVTLTHPPEVEDAVVQVMTYLVENELAALIVPSRFIARVHPNFREVVQLLAVQCADEARHVEVFSRRASLSGREPGTSSVGGRASLQSLFDEHDYHLSAFLLSVLGEGSFLSLLAFLEEHAPDPVTAGIARLTLRDERRHVAFGQAHLEHVTETAPDVRPALRAAVERRYASLANTAGLNRDVEHSLVLLAAGGWSIDEIRRGARAVARLQQEMYDGRVRRLERLGFPGADAHELSALHTRNFM